MLLMPAHQYDNKYIVCTYIRTDTYIHKYVSKYNHCLMVLQDSFLQFYKLNINRYLEALSLHYFTTNLSDFLHYSIHLTNHKFFLSSSMSPPITQIDVSGFSTQKAFSFSLSRESNFHTKQRSPPLPRAHQPPPQQLPYCVIGAVVVCCCCCCAYFIFVLL